MYQTTQHYNADERKLKLCMISGFCFEADETYTLLDYYAAGSGNSLLTIQDDLCTLQDVLNCPRVHMIILKLLLLQLYTEFCLYNIPSNFKTLNIASTAGARYFSLL
jgi:hypothetical protein